LDDQRRGTMAFEIKSSAFEPGQPIPKKYTCEGSDVSVSLAWTDPPAGTKSLALIADDPDAPMGTWVHWVAYDLPPEARGLPEGVPKQETLQDGTRQGLNDFRRVGYGGPCPPPGKPHRYFFKLYALDKKLGLPPRSTKSRVLDAMKNHVLVEAQVMGTYKR
jgi:Raf kinase inhibitor-like YbhB/YbcL family protein